MAELFLIRGLPGSGKSTFAHTLCSALNPDDWMEEPNTFHFENDMYHIKNGVYKFKPELVHMAAKWCQDITENHLKLGFNVVVSNTFVQKWQLNPYTHMAKRLNVPYTIITMNGNFGSIHNIPEETMERMRRQWENLV